MSTPTIAPETAATEVEATDETAEAEAATQPSGRLARLTPYLPGRREAMFAIGGGVLGAALAGGTMGARALSGGHAAEVRDDKAELTHKEALARLTEGNHRFVTGTTTHPDQTVERRAALAAGQHPFAAVLSCADSRVPPEVIFDQGLGDLFVVRSAGQVVDHAVMGSLQYGVGELGTPLLVVLGHSKCGAVKATIEALESKADPTGTDIDALIAAIKPAVEEAEELGATEKKLLSVSVDMNVERAVESLKTAPVLSNASRLRKVKIVGATYDVATGEVEWL